MKRKHKIEFIIVSIIILALSAVLVYQFRFNRKFLYEQGRVLCEQGQYDKAIPCYIKLLKRCEQGKDVEEARQALFCEALPNAKMLLDISDVALAVEAFRNSKSQRVRGMAELALIHIGMEVSMKPGGEYGSFLKWWRETVGDIGRPPGMALVPAGQFIMGSPESEWGPYGLIDRYRNEFPQHRVYISEAFYISKYEVTQKQYEAVMGYNPSNSKGPSKPVEQVSWSDAIEFCRRLSGKEENKYRLPTEAEWEYACRAGTQTRFCCGHYIGYERLGEYAWCEANGDGKTHPVGQKKPNAWGLYDVHGNVWEWCADWYDENYYKKSPRENPEGPDSGTTRVVRGGRWHDFNSMRSAHREHFNPTLKCFVVGFRYAGFVTP